MSLHDNGMMLIHCSYTYSLVFAADMYATVFKKNPLDPSLGQQYQKEILLPGGSRDELVSLEVCY